MSVISTNKKSAMRVLYLVLAIAALSLAAWGCSTLGDNVEDGQHMKADESFTAALPAYKFLEVYVPNGSAQASAKLIDGEDSTDGLYKKATFYNMAQGAASDWNKIVKQLFAPAVLVSGLEPTALESGKNTWEQKSPIDEGAVTLPRLIITNTGTDQYNLAYDLVPVEITDETRYYRHIWFGDVITGESGRGQGDFIINLAAAHSIEPKYTSSGTIELAYDTTSNTEVSFTANFLQFKPNAESTTVPTINYTSEYWMKDSGETYFTYSERLNWSRVTEDFERFDFQFHWSQAGPGQTEATIIGNDLTAQKKEKVIIRECWDENFYQTYYAEYAFWDQTQYAEEVPSPTMGKVSGNVANCPFEFEDLNSEVEGDGDLEDEDGDMDSELTEDQQDDTARCISYCNKAGECDTTDDLDDTWLGACIDDCNTYQGQPDTFKEKIDCVEFDDCTDFNNCNSVS